MCQFLIIAYLFTLVCFEPNALRIYAMHERSKKALSALYIVVVVVCSGLTSLSIIFQSYNDGVWLLQGAQCSLL